MSVRYWIIQHIPDVIRQERCNVGVLATNGVEHELRFWGERAPGELDRRKLRNHPAPRTYQQWVTFWREELAETDDPRALLHHVGANYTIVEGGEVTDTADDPLTQITAHLFQLLVDAQGIRGVLDDHDVETTQRLQDALKNTFSNAGLLGGAAAAQIRHPILEAAAITGNVTTHHPTFSQRNGHLYIMEPIDLSRPRALHHAHTRSGFAAYMFSDIRRCEHDVEAIAIVQLDQTLRDPRVEEAHELLAAEARVVNWSDARARQAFLEERIAIALG